MAYRQINPDQFLPVKKESVKSPAPPPPSVVRVVTLDLTGQDSAPKEPSVTFAKGPPTEIEVDSVEEHTTPSEDPDIESKLIHQKSSGKDGSTSSESVCQKWLESERRSNSDKQFESRSENSSNLLHFPIERSSSNSSPSHRRHHNHHKKISQQISTALEQAVDLNFGVPGTPSPQPTRDNHKDSSHWKMDPNAVRHYGGCHCGAVRFEVYASTTPKVIECNCSICVKKQNRHFIVPESNFKLLKGHNSLTTYSFNTHSAKHIFCSVCGVQSFYIPRSNSDGYGIVVHCLDEGTVKKEKVEKFDGKNWDAEMKKKPHILNYSKEKI